MFGPLPTWGGEGGLRPLPLPATITLALPVVTYQPLLEPLESFMSELLVAMSNSVTVFNDESKET